MEGKRSPGQLWLSWVSQTKGGRHRLLRPRAQEASLSAGGSGETPNGLSEPGPTNSATPSSSVERRSRGDASVGVANDCSPSMSPRAQEPKMCTVLMSVWRTGDVTFALVAWRCYNGPPLPHARGSSQSPLHFQALLPVHAPVTTCRLAGESDQR